MHQKLRGGKDTEVGQMVHLNHLIKWTKSLLLLIAYCAYDGLCTPLIDGHEIVKVGK